MIEQLPDQRDVEVILVLANLTLGFLAFYFVPKSKRIRIRIESGYGTEKSLGILVLFRRLCGFVFLGIIPALVTWAGSGGNLLKYGFGGGNLQESIFWTGILSVIIIVLNVFNARKPSNLAVYPEIRIRRWSSRLLVISSISWVVYLIAYESLFRGLFLFTFEAWFGPVIAIAINVSIYSLTHIYKGIKEAAGAIPFGILICWVTLQTGNIWSAVAVHIVMALSNEYLSLYFHPEISVKKR